MEHEGGMPITEEQLKEWEEIEQAATPGPWDCYVFGPPGKSLAVLPCGDRHWEACNKCEEATEDDMKFINASRKALPLLLQEYRDLQQAYREALKEISYLRQFEPGKLTQVIHRHDAIEPCEGKSHELSVIYDR